MKPQPAEDPEDDESDEVEERLDELDAENADEIEGADDPFDGEEDVEEEIDVDLADTDVGQPIEHGETAGEAGEHDEWDDVGDYGADSPFDGREDAGEWDGAGGGTDDWKEQAGAAMEEADQPLADTINDGAARLSVVGLPDNFYHNGEMMSKSDLQTEFREVFEEFRLGHYGGQVAEEYLFVEDDDIDPLWGFAASALACVALVVWMRPDGDELIDKVRNRASDVRDAAEEAEV